MVSIIRVKCNGNKRKRRRRTREGARALRVDARDEGVHRLREGDHLRAGARRGRTASSCGVRESVRERAWSEGKG